MKLHKITTYKLLQEMELDPIECQTNWTKKIKGKGRVSEIEKKLLEKTLLRLTGSKIVMINFQPTYYKII